MVTILKDIPIDGIEVIPCRLNGPRGIVKCFLVHDDSGVVLVDSGYDDADAERVAARVTGIGRDMSELKAVVLTHSHGDHIGGLSRLREMADFVVVGHTDEAESIEGRTGRPADALVKDGDVIDALPGGLRIVHMPGHTAGHIGMYHARSKSFLAGDSIFSAGEHAVVTPPYLADDPAAARESVRRLIAMDLDIQTLLVAHGDDIVGDASLIFERILGERRCI